jgi:phosphoglycolate phosphatase
MANLSGYTIAFDLDGTLVDTAPDIHRALNHVMAAEGLPPASLQDVRTFVGQGPRALIVRACAVHGVFHDDSRLGDITEAYVQTYASDIAARSTVFPGLIDAMERLAAMGARFCVCTNKRTDLSNQLLAVLGMSSHFAAVIGADSVKNRKPHPDHFIASVRAAGGDPARALMVGDSAADVGSARAASAPVVVVSFGYADTAPELLGADAVLHNYTDLPDLAVRLLNPQPMPRT